MVHNIPQHHVKKIQKHGYYHNKVRKPRTTIFDIVLDKIEHGETLPQIHSALTMKGSSQHGGALVTPEQKSIGQRYAIFAMVSYIPEMEDKMKFLKDKSKTDWDIDTSLTNQNGTDYVTTIVNRKTGQVIVSIRGTIWSQFQDVLTNLGFVFGVGRLTPKANEVMYQVSKVLQKYGKGRVVLVGHSQGGELARQNANRFGLPAYIYNRAAAMLDIFNVKNPSIIEFDTNFGGQFDIVSWFSHQQQKHTKSEFLVKQGMSSHTLENYIPETQEEIEQTGNGLGKRLPVIPQGRVGTPIVFRKKIIS
jgi:hypothetical protein